MESHTHVQQPAFVARDGGRLEALSLCSRGMLFLGAQRMRCWHFPKAEPGYGYQRREVDAGAKATDVYFKTLLFRHNLSPKQQQIKTDTLRVPLTCVRLEGLGAGSAPLRQGGQSVAQNLLKIPPLFMNTEGKEGRKERRKREREGKQGRTLVQSRYLRCVNSWKKKFKGPAPQKSLIIYLEYFLLPSFP